MNEAISLFWHDYETFGANPKIDRPAQFAGVRTDLNLNQIDEPLQIYCQPADDYLPNPEACLITGITPQKAMQEGVSEFEFISLIHAAFSKPGTCVVGYNSIRFDDEITRYTLFRNLFDPYAREWQNGNSRWDLIDLLRLVFVLKPETLIWPRKEDGSPSFKLEELTRLNDIDHGQAHDAMSDVHATINLAKKIRQLCPDLYDYVFEHRQKQSVQKLLAEQAGKPLLHVSSKYPASVGACSVVFPVARHPDNPNGTIVFDLRQDPMVLEVLSAEKIAERVFTSAVQLPEGVARIGLKTVHANKCPVIVPTSFMSGLSESHLKCLNLDGDQLRAHIRCIKEIEGLEAKIQAAFRKSEAFPVDSDPEFSLYSGDFLGRADRAALDSVTAALRREERPPVVSFQDNRLEELVFRLKGRCFPRLLEDDEYERWEEHRKQRLMGNHENGLLNFHAFFEQLQRLTARPDLGTFERHVLEELRYYGESLIPY